MALSNLDADALFASVQPAKPSLTPEAAEAVFADAKPAAPSLTEQDADAIFARADAPVGPPSGINRAFSALTGIKDTLAGLGAATDASKSFVFSGLSESITNPYRDAAALLLGKDPSQIDVDIGPFEATRFADDQRAEGRAAQALANKLKPKGGAPEFLFDAAQAIIQMAPAVAVSMATRSPNAALAVMGTQVYGDAYARARDAGKDAQGAKADALVALITEIGPEKAFSFFDNLVFGAGIKNIIMKAAAEAPSEGLTSILQIADEMGRQGKDINPAEAVGRVLRDTALGFTVGGTLAIPSALGPQPTPAPVQGPPTPEELAVDYAVARAYDLLPEKRGLFQLPAQPQPAAAPVTPPAAAPVPPQPVPAAPEPVQAPAAVPAVPPELQATVEHLRKSGLEAVDPLALEIDPATFQYKSGGDEQGVLETLKSVKEWDDNKAGTIMVYEYADGRRVVADGHQRVGLARRLKPEGGIRIMAKVLRESDGFTPADARRIAAETNIAQGTGTAVDAAKVLREISPEARAGVLAKMPVASSMVRDALGLTKLGETAFMNVVNEQVSPAFGALVGERFEDPAQQEAAMQVIIRHNPTTADQVRAMLEDMAAAGFQKSEQGGLFGDEQLESLIGERSKILSAALSSARKDKALFGKLVGSAGVITQAGNVLATATNEQILQQTQQLLATLIKSINTTPELNGVLNALASQVKSGEITSRRAAGQFLEAARAHLERSGGAGPQRSGNEGAGPEAPAGTGFLTQPQAPAEPGPAPGGEQGSLIAPPTPGENLAAAQQAAAAQRSGLGVDLVPPESGGGELFAGNEPGQRPAQMVVPGAEPTSGIGPVAERTKAETVDLLKRAQSAPEGAEAFLAAFASDIANQAGAMAAAAWAVEDTQEIAAAAGIDAAVVKRYGELLEKVADEAAASDAARREAGELPQREQNQARHEQLIEASEPAEFWKEPKETVFAAKEAPPVIPKAEADATVQAWKDEAKRIGREEDHSNEVVISLFDFTGNWSQPYVDAGYDVIRLDIKRGDDLLLDLSAYLLDIQQLLSSGKKIVGVLAAPPCTSYASSGARWWKDVHTTDKVVLGEVEKRFGAKMTEYFESPLQYNDFLLMATEAIIAEASPSQFFVVENPRGRIRSRMKLPDPSLVFNPNHFGDPYTKETFLYGTFNTDLPFAHVEATEGSKVQSKLSSKQKAEREMTPEGFAYAFFMANSTAKKKRPSVETEQPTTRTGSPEFNRLSFTERPTHFHDIWSENGIDPDTASTWPMERQVARAKAILLDKFGFAAINIDPKMPKIKARDQMADAYRNLSFVASVLGLPAKAIGLSNTLSLTLVKRAPYLGALIDGNMIVMPGRSNSFGHEWGHALDYWLLNRIAPGDYAGLSGRVRKDGVEPPPASVEEAFVSLMDNLFFDQSTIAAEIMLLEQQAQNGTDRQKAQANQRLEELRQGRSKTTKDRSDYYRSANAYGDPDYWNKPTEMLARAFEAYIANRIENAGGTNEFVSKGDENYLNDVEERLAKTFPKLQERERIFAAFDRLFNMIAGEQMFRGTPEQMPGPGDKVDLRKYVIHDEAGTFNARALFNIHKSLAAGISEFVKREKAKPAHHESWARRLDGLRTLLFDTIRSRARVLEKLNPQSAAMRAFFNMVLLEPGANRAVKETFQEEVSRLYTGFIGTYNNILSNNGLGSMDSDVNVMLRNVLLGNEVPNAPANVKRAAAAIRKLLEKQWYEMQRAGIDVGSVSDKGYLPRTYKEAEILADREGFIRDATILMRDYQFPHELGVKRLPRDQWAERIFGDQSSARLFMSYVRRAARSNPGIKNAVKALRKKVRKADTLSDPDAQAQAIQAAYNEFLDAVYDDVAQSFGEHRAAAWDFSIARPNVEDYFMPGQPGVPVTKGRSLVGEADDVMAKWLENDVSVMLERYARSTARKVGYVKRFGKDNKKYDQLIDQMVRDGVHKTHIDEARKLVDKVLGRERNILPVRGQAFFDWGHTLGYMVLLNLATFSSLAEASAYGIRSGNLKNSFAPIVMLVRALTRSKKSRELRNLALTMNIIGGRATEAVLNNMMGGDYTFSPRARGVMTKFFETTLLTQLTEAQRAYGVQVADEYLRKYAKDWIANQNRAEAEARMRELGVDNFEEFSTWLLQDNHYPTAEELYDRDGFATPRGEQYMLAVRRFVDQGIQNPDISLRPELASNPFGRMMYGIMAFSYAFYENLIKREIKVIRRKGLSDGAKWAVTHTVPAFLLLGVQQIIVSTIRELIFHADKYEDMDDEEAAERLLLIGINRSYGYGGIDPMIQYALGLKYQRGMAETAVGAVPGYFFDNADNLFKMFTESNSENTSTAEYRFGEAIYNLAMAPAMSFAASMLGSFGGGAGRLIATPAVYSIRSWREEFASLFGTKPDRQDEVDEELADLRSEYDKKLDAISEQIRQAPAEQWDAELERLRQEYPEILQDAQFKRYSARSSENIIKGRVGRPQVNKSRVQFTGLPEEYKSTAEEKAYNSAIRLILRGNGLTYGKLFEQVPEGMSPLLDKVRAQRDPAAKVGSGFVADLREELEDARREYKREKIKAIRLQEGK